MHSLSPTNKANKANKAEEWAIFNFFWLFSPLKRDNAHQKNKEEIGKTTNPILDDR